MPNDKTQKDHGYELGRLIYARTAESLHKARNRLVKTNDVRDVNSGSLTAASYLVADVLAIAVDKREDRLSVWDNLSRLIVERILQHKSR